MSFSVRIFLGFFLVIGIGAYLFFTSFVDELRPAIKQSAEESLVESANLLAELVMPEVKNGNINNGRFSYVYEAFLKRKLNAKIWSVKKTQSSLRVYITNKQGRVIFDSTGEALGDDYSQWNDVYLTLKGEYGVRSSNSIPTDSSSSTMYVAAPILDNGNIIGSLTLAKASRDIQPFIDASRKKMRTEGLFLILLSLAMGAILSIWLTRSIRALVSYAEQVKAGKKTVVPYLGKSELGVLGNSIEQMRIELEGKNYVEKYIHTLTHELKSPVAAIKGAAELLEGPMSQEDQTHFIGNIQGQVLRMEDMITRLLQLAALENRQELHDVNDIDLVELISSLIESKVGELRAKSLLLTFDRHNDESSQINRGHYIIKGERFLIVQGLDNLLKNAIEFSHIKSEIKIFMQLINQNELSIGISNQGPNIPDYAITRIFDRFYSLPRPDGSAKSSGLGLGFVAQMAELHGGGITLENNVDGVTAQLTLLIHSTS